MTMTDRKPFSQEAQNIAYKTGIRELAPLVDRIRALEQTVAELKTRVDAFERSTAPHLREREVR